MKISVTFSRTKNLGNFNSVRAEASVETTVDLTQESSEGAYALLWKTVKEQVQDQLKKEMV